MFDLAAVVETGTPLIGKPEKHCGIPRQAIIISAYFRMDLIDTGCDEYFVLKFQFSPFNPSPDRQRKIIGNPVGNHRA